MKTELMTQDNIYETDFYTWSCQQAQLLREKNLIKWIGAMLLRRFLTWDAVNIELLYW